ncbi:MAG TPA: hypothetical protein VHN77_04470 [Phycisphaerales bacterium]|nr:hypothetical protein [Phycisphaerales bacterium]
MALPGVMVGCILEPLSHDDFMRTWNDRVINDLPHADTEYPPLCRPMFSLPATDDRWHRYQGSRAIAFAIHQKYFDEDAHLWLPKLEDLLKRLFWDEVIIHLHGCRVGGLKVTYDLTPDGKQRLQEKPPRPPADAVLRCVRATSEVPDRFATGISDLPHATDEPESKPVPDRVRVERMLAIAREVSSVIAGKHKSDLDNDRVLLRALAHAIRELVDEARHVGTSTRFAHPMVAWPKIHLAGTFAAGRLDEPNMPEAIWEIASGARGVVPGLELALANWTDGK